MDRLTKDTFQRNYRPMPHFPPVYRLAYLQTWSAPGAALAAKRAMLCFAAKKSAGTAQEQQTRLFRLALSCGREQRLRAAFGGRDPLTRELTFSAPEAARAFTAVGKLNTTQRTVLYLYYNKDYSMAQIAALLRRSEGAVSRALQKAQAALKAELGEQDWKALLQGMFAVIQPEESLKAEVEVALAQGKTGRSPAVKYAAAGALALLVVVAFVAAPLLESRPAQGAVSSAASEAAPGKTAEGQENGAQFLLMSSTGESGERDITATEIPVPLSNPYTETRYVYPNKIYKTIYDLGLQCNASGQGKRVIYTAVNCKLMRKNVNVLTQGQDGVSLPINSGDSIQEYGGTNIPFIYSPIGYVISADPADLADIVSLGIQVTYQVERGKSAGGEAKDYTPEVNAALQKAAQDASIQLEVQMEDGSSIRRTVKFGYDKAGAMTAWMERD